MEKKIDCVDCPFCHSKIIFDDSDDSFEYIDYCSYFDIDVGYLGCCEREVLPKEDFYFNEDSL